MGNPLSQTEPVRILLEIFQNDEGAVRSLHHPASPEDSLRMQGWPSGGLVQVGHAMFIEALRREAYTMAITQLSTGKKPEELDAKDLAEHVTAHWMKMLEQFSGPAAEEVLKMLTSSPESPSSEHLQRLPPSTG